MEQEILKGYLVLAHGRLVNGGDSGMIGMYAILELPLFHRNILHPPQGEKTWPLHLTLKPPLKSR
jgi:hypothetical protein